jgi:hypothetical protein
MLVSGMILSLSSSWLSPSMATCTGSVQCLQSAAPNLFLVSHMSLYGQVQI